MSSELRTTPPVITVTAPVTAVTVNGQPATVNGLSFASTLTLAEGQNTLNVTAVDRAGNSGAAAVTVKLDATAPGQPVLAPLQTPANVAVVAVSGTAEAGSAVKISSAGALIGTVSADSQGNFTLPDVTLQKGSNSFTAVATDAAGNDSPQSQPLAVVLDTVKPVITVTAPQAGVIISSSETAISGSVNEPVTSLTVNGQPATVNDLSFFSILPLAAGPNSALIIATDPAGNSATITLTIQRDSVPPVVTITAPQPGLLTRNGIVQVSGTVDDAEAVVTVNGQPVTVNGFAFTTTYTLSDGDNTITVEATDKAGNKGTAATSVTLDAVPPLVAITAPAEAVAGANIAISLNAGDNRALALVELKADGVPIWSGNSAPAISEAVAYRLSPALNAGSVVTLQARGTDAAGNEGTAAATIQITQAAMGPGYLQGKVLDDSRGLLLGGATVTITDAKSGSATFSANDDGSYFKETAAGAALAIIAKTGFTTVERVVAILPEKKSIALDARLSLTISISNLRTRTQPCLTKKLQLLQ